MNKRLTPPPTPSLPPLVARGAAAIAFYTCLPVPARWPLDFQGIARYAPLVGLGIGALLALGDLLLTVAGLPVLTRSALVVALWLAVTGGLHLDGAIDTADGLAVPVPQRRLEVMADSRSGAFGVMAAVVVLGLKALALADIAETRWLALMAAAGWGRWGQVVAIVCYPYLKPSGKGAFHKQHSQPRWDLWPGSLALLALLGSCAAFSLAPWQRLAAIALGGLALSTLTGAWLNHKLGGHTGDTYGAVVEWTEALLLCLLTTL